jgi:hypothetical protein
MSDDKDPLHPSDEEIIQEAIDFLKQAEEAESENRRNGMEALRFRHGEQWPPEIQNSRKLEQRPCLVINKTDAFCLQVANQQRQQRPRIKVEPAGGGAKKKIADIVKGMIRHIENNGGGGDLAYDTAFDSALTIGWGYCRIMARYVREDAFEQELYLAPIDNPFSCYRDPDSTMPDGSDMERFLITDKMGKKAFKRSYPEAEDANFTEGGNGDLLPDWLTKDEIRVAEYFKIRRKRALLCMLSDGSKAWKDELPSDDVLMAAGVAVVDQRESYRSVVCWYKITAREVLERKELPGRFIPVVVMYGKVEVIDGKRHLSGLVRNAMDPQRQYNFWRTAMVESVALAPKAKWVIAEGQDEGHENEWATANTSATATMRYVPVDVNGNPAPPPNRIQPEGPPQGAMVMAETMSNDLTSVLGIVDPAMRIGGNVSGKALNAERQQSDNSTFHFYDNMTRMMRFIGEQLLDLIPPYYHEEGRIVRIVGDDGRSSQETINAPNPSPGQDTPGPVESVLNDVTVGEYDIVMDTGPGYNTKRQESLAVMGPMFERNENLMQIAGDVFFRNMDFEGSDTIADRMAAANPLAQIDEKSDIPPGVQMKLKQQEQQIKQMGDQIQAMGMEIKFKADLQAQKDEAATKRELIKSTAAVHIEDQENKAWREDTQINAATKRHDTEVRSQTALGVAEIAATGQLLKTKVDNEHDLKRLQHESTENEKQLAATSAKE